MTEPRYQEVKSADIPEVTDNDGTHVRLVYGRFWGKTGPVEATRNAFAYVFAGSGTFCNASIPLAVPTEGVGWWPHAIPPAEVDNPDKKIS